MGICQCVLGGRIDLRPGADPSGSDETDAGKSDGPFSDDRDRAWIPGRI